MQAYLNATLLPRPSPVHILVGHDSSMRRRALGERGSSSNPPTTEIKTLSRSMFAGRGKRRGESAGKVHTGAQCASAISVASAPNEGKCGSEIKQC